MRITDRSMLLTDIPLAASHPHFYGRQPQKLADRIEGLHPNKQDHGSYIIVEPTTGVPIDQCARSQSNVVTPKFRGFLNEVQLFSEMVVPIFWVEYVSENHHNHQSQSNIFSILHVLAAPERTHQRNYRHADIHRARGANTIEYPARHISACRSHIRGAGRQSVYGCPQFLYRSAQQSTISVTKTTITINQRWYHFQQSNVAYKRERTHRIIISMNKCRSFWPKILFAYIHHK